jgi:hypothetical protein
MSESRRLREGGVGLLRGEPVNWPPSGVGARRSARARSEVNAVCVGGAREVGFLAVLGVR